MMLLVSVVADSGFGGMQMVNRLIIEAAQSEDIAGTIISLHDQTTRGWSDAYPNSYAANGSRLSFTVSALRRRHWARASIILATHISLAPVGRVVKHFSGGKFAMFLHGVEAWEALPGRVRWGLRGCDYLVANSNFTLEKFYTVHREFADIPGQVIYLPARELNGEEKDQPLAITLPDRLRVLVVGRLWGRGLLKGQRQLIAIWPQIIDEFPDAELCIVGAGEGRNDFEAFARASGVAEAIRFTGEVTDSELEAIYQQSAVYAMPSQGEGFGLVFAEAMAHGLPCIASRFDAGSEVVAHGATGLHVDPDNLEELREAMRTLLGDTEIRKRMGEAGRIRATEQFSLSRFNPDITDLLRSASLSVESKL